MYSRDNIFQRTALLAGNKAMDMLGQKKVILFGIGGVGSWCAEGLIRSGVQHLTLVDSDRVCVSNINRQLQATSRTVGLVKTDALKERLLEINPDAQITTVQKIYNGDSRHSFVLERYDYIIDAIDSLSPKIELIRHATRTPATLFSSMGASLRVDPTQIKVAEFWDVTGCHLAARIRKLIRKGDLPARKFLCVFSQELLENKGGGNMGHQQFVNQKSNAEGRPDLADHEWSSAKAVINGTFCHITAIFGFTLSGLVIREVLESAG